MKKLEDIYGELDARHQEIVYATVELVGWARSLFSEMSIHHDAMRLKAIADAYFNMYRHFAALYRTGTSDKRICPELEKIHAWLRKRGYGEYVRMSRKILDKSSACVGTWVDVTPTEAHAIVCRMRDAAMAKPTATPAQAEESGDRDAQDGLTTISYGQNAADPKQ